MAELFESSSIGSIDLPNRSIRSATWSGVGDENGFVTDRAEHIYGELAKGGVGLIITGYQYVMLNGQQLPYMVGNYSKDCLNGLTRLAQIVHSRGSKVITQLVHTGARANPKLLKTGDEVWAPSALPDPLTGKIPKEVDKDEILRLVEAYAAAARRAQDAGFDGVQLHGAHGYGINQFLSPAWNQRSDSYGGSVKNRYRFLGETLEAVKETVGDDFPILIKLSGNDYVEHGLTPEESLQIAKRLQDDGIAAIEVSGGSAVSPKNLGPVRQKIRSQGDEAYFSDIAKYFNENLRTPIITVGGIRSLKVVEDILHDKKADYVSFSRPLIREPDLINKWKSGDSATASCISCNGCFESGLKGIGITCKAKASKDKGKE